MADDSARQLYAVVSQVLVLTSRVPLLTTPQNYTFFPKNQTPLPNYLHHPTASPPHRLCFQII